MNDNDNDVFLAYVLLFAIESFAKKIISTHN